jgi:hypothetical protein
VVVKDSIRVVLADDLSTRWRIVIAHRTAIHRSTGSESKQKYAIEDICH